MLVDVVSTVLSVFEAAVAANKGGVLYWSRPSVGGVRGQRAVHVLLVWWLV